MYRRGLLLWIVVLAPGCGDNHGVVAGDPDVPIACDDHNPCTDDRVEGGACRFDAVEDGRPCDDGNFCTLGDRCRAGQCVAGAASSGPLAQLGTLDTLAGGGIGVLGDRFVSITGPSWSTHVRVAERQGANLAIVASWDGRLDVTFSTDGLTQALDGGLLAVAARQDRPLAIFSTAFPKAAPASIVKRGTATLDGQILSLAGHGHRIWACTRDFFRGSEVALVDVGDPDAPVVVGSLRMPKDCGSVATSDDGTRVYVNTQDGVRFVDARPLDTGGDPTLSDVFAATAGVSAAAGHLVLRESGAVRIVRQSDFGEVVSIAVGGVLAASLVGDQLVVEGWRTTSSGGMEAFAALYDALGSAPGARLDEVIVQRVSFQGDVGPSFRNAVTGGGTLITGLGPRMFDLANGHLVEQRAPALTPLDQLSRAAGGVLAIGFAGSATVDARVPQAPVFAGGGAFGVPVRFEATLDDSAPPQVLFGYRADVPSRSGVGRSWEPDPLPVDRWTLDGDGRPRVTGSFLLPNSGEGQLVIAGGDLVRMRSPLAPGFDVTLQGWPVAALGRAGELARAAFELRLSPSPPFAASSGSARGAFDVDAGAQRAVVTTGASSGATSEGALFWLDLATTPPTVLEQVRFDARPDEVRVAGSRAVVSTHLELLWFELGKGLIARQKPTAQAFVEHLLGFDGRTAYYAILDFTAGLAVGLGASRFGDSGPAAPLLPLGGTAASLVETDGALVVGLPNQLVTVRPHCD